MRNELLKLVICSTLSASLLLLVPHGNARADTARPDFEVTIVEGDTLTALGQRWLADPGRWPELQRHNKIPDPKRLAPGSKLAIPVAWLREKPAEVTVSNVSGQASKADGTPVAVGQRLREGEEIKTAENGYVTIKLVDGSTLRLQARSNLKLERARNLPGSEATETRFQLPAGRAEVQVRPGAQKASRFELRTGYASAAVRGTAFRVSADERNTRTEVTEGTIAFAGLPPNAGSEPPEQSVPIPQGYGSIVDESRKPIPPVRLLDAPSLPTDPVFKAAPSLELDFPALAGAVSYRAQLAADADFRRMVGEAVLTQPKIKFSNLTAGSYVLRIRAIDKFGLEGRDAIAYIGMLPTEPSVPRKSEPAASAPGPAPVQNR